MAYRIIGRKERSYTIPNTITEFSLDEMRDQISEEYKHRFLTKAAKPHDYVNIQYILWPKRKVQNLTELNVEETKDLMNILQGRYNQNYTCFRNCPDDVSIPQKLHFHIAQFHHVISISDVRIHKDNTTDI